MALLEYRSRNTMLHRLHPISKAIWILSVGLLLSVYFDPVPLIVILFLNIPFFILGKIPWQRWMKPLGYVLLLGMIGYFVVSLWLARPDIFTRYPALSSKVILRFTGEDFFLGPMAITVGGLLYTIGQTLRSMTLVFIFAVFVYSTPPSDLVYLLSKARLPPKLIFIVMVAYRFFPHVLRKLSIVTAAQKLRGWELNSRNPIRLAKQYLPVTIPVLTEIVRLSEHTTWAVESRAYGTGGFTLHRNLVLKTSDWIFSIFWLAVSSLLFYLYLRFGIGSL